MAAEVISAAGFPVSVYDAMPSVGRKFLLAGIGGMNITHAENPSRFLSRYSDAQAFLTPFIQAFNAETLREWVHGLGIATFVGSSQRVFPQDMKAAPLLRAWLHRLRQQGVNFFPRHRWQGWNAEGALRFSTTDTAAEILVTHRACLLALGGGSWPQLGSDGAWVKLLRDRHIDITELHPSNCGFETMWSAFFVERFAGAPLATVRLTTTGYNGQSHSVRGECVISRYGIEGSAVYTLAQPLRRQIQQSGTAQLWLDLLPDLDASRIATALQKPRGKVSINNFLRKQLTLTPIKIALLKELAPVALAQMTQDAEALAHAIKHLPLSLSRPRPLAEAISSAGGVSLTAVDEYLMLKKMPGTFCAGEMLDWEAPTGGYLLTACFATGRAAGHGICRWLTCAAQERSAMP